MERFIRRKYEFREFSGGAGRRAASHNTGNASVSSSEDQPPPLPPKPGKRFGFALRSASATFTRPRMDKYAAPMSPPLSGEDVPDSPPRVNKASRVFGSSVGNAHDDAFNAKMASLREMGFTDARRNSFVLKEMNGSLSGSIEALVRLGSGNKSASRNPTPVSTASGSGLTVEKRRALDNPPEAPPKDTKDPVDPFAALDYESQPQLPRRAATQPIPQHSQTPQSLQSYSYNNPFLNNIPQTQAPQALQDPFAGMQISAAPQQDQYVNAPVQQVQPPLQQMPTNQYNNPFMNNNTYQQQPQMQTMIQPPQQEQQQQHQQFQAQPSSQQQQPSQYTYAQPIQPQHTSNPFLRGSKSQTFSTLR